MKKQLLTLLLALICVSGFAQTAVWIEQNSGFVPVSSGVRYVSTVDSNIVWICAYDGSGGGANRQDFSRTTDGGATWTSGTIPVPASYDWSMIHGVSADTAFAVFYDANATTGGGIWRTVDGGATWTQCGVGTMYPTAASFPNVVHFWNNLDGFAMGDPLGGYFEIYTTNDGGDNWTRVPQANIAAHFLVNTELLVTTVLSATTYGSTPKKAVFTVRTTVVLPGKQLPPVLPFQRMALLTSLSTAKPAVSLASILQPV